MHILGLVTYDTGILALIPAAPTSPMSSLLPDERKRRDIEESSVDAKPASA